MEPFIMINILNDPVIHTGIERLWHQATTIFDDYLVSSVLTILGKLI